MEQIDEINAIKPGIEKINEDLLTIGEDYYDLKTGVIVKVIRIDPEKYADRKVVTYKDTDCSLIPTEVDYVSHYMNVPTDDKEVCLDWYTHLIQNGDIKCLTNSHGFNSELYTLVSSVKPNKLGGGSFTIKCGACGSRVVELTEKGLTCRICENKVNIGPYTVLTFT